jgi:hypothetical protein
MCAEHNCPKIAIHEWGYTVISCMADWVETLIGRATLCDVVPGGAEGVRLVFNNGVTLPLLSADAGRIVHIADANVLLENVASARFEQMAYQSSGERAAITLTFRKPNGGGVLIVETHPASVLQMTAPRVMKG